MKIETKYKIGDEYWTMVNNKPEKIRVGLIKIQISQESNGCYSHSQRIEIAYFNEFSERGVLEKDFYTSKEELLKSL